MTTYRAITVTARVATILTFVVIVMDYLAK